MQITKTIIKKNLNSLYNFLAKLEKHHVSEYAVQCAYYIILAFIPFIILLFSLIQYTSIGKDAIFFLAEEIIPGNIYSFVENIMREASFKSLGTLSISIVILIWSAGKGFFALCKGFHYIYETPKEYNYWFIKFKSMISIVIFIFMTVIVLLLIAFGNRIASFIKFKYTSLSTTINLILNWRIVWQYLILFIFFWLMYKYVPNHKVKFRTQIPGALFSAFSWYFLSYIFSIYLRIFTNFSVIYGSLTSLILLMIWVYWCMFAILIGAEINSWVDKQNINKVKKLK